MTKVRDAMSDILDRLTVADMLMMTDSRKVSLMYHI
jgi:DNA-binding IscR family transcriptional regulator